ncbi:DUF4279 domain-containing protein [Gemmata sp. JC717]|uniref:DUF4279 domain-containing protein n=1 Tax=Gemmata algarum TaxID=2975278 RepID=UPI0021BB7F52|nr:DUF4279 domain-containing protein [Gemmata algarum]MDY3554228.1 DUF4279 domain-containing protein [Gemmata algarum]
MSDQPGEPFDAARPLIRVGGPIDSCSACLCIFGEDLDPEAVTAVLGAVPTTACRKGDVTRRKVTTRIEPHGKWLLSIKHRSGATLEAVINELLDRLTGDLAVWANLTKRYRADLFCGLQMESWNRGLSFSPETLRRVAERGLELGLDIYYVGSDRPEGPVP